MDINSYFKDRNILLTDCQLKAANKLADFLQNDKRIFILNGYAGTGKTFLISELIKFLNQNSTYKSKVLTPTGRAAKVVKDKLKMPDIASTIHRLIYDFDKIQYYCDEKEDGIDCTVVKAESDKCPQHKNSLLPRSVFKVRRCFCNSKCEDSCPQRNSFNLFFIDEASMLSSENSNSKHLHYGSGNIFSDLLNFSLGQKIIFIGDNAQLPPINMNHSPALNRKFLTNILKIEEDKIDEASLESIIRQDKDSSILNNATFLRNCIKNKNYYQLQFHFDKDDMINVLGNPIEKYVNHFIKDDMNSVIFLTHSNRNAYFYNINIRKKIFDQEEGESLINAERLICVANNYTHDIFNGELVIINKLLGTPNELKVELSASEQNRDYFSNLHGKNYSEKSMDGNTYKLKRIPISLTFQEANILYIDDSGKIANKDVLLNTTILNDPEARELLPIHNQALAVHFKITKKENDEEYTKKYREALLVKYGYSLVVHKAQGGEWDNVITDYNVHDNYNKYKETYFRWCYTALTRSTEKHYVFNNPNLYNEELWKKEILEKERMDDLLNYLNRKR